MDETPIHMIEMVRSIRDQLYKETRRMSPEEFMEFITTEAEKVIGAYRNASEVIPDPVRTGAQYGMRSQSTPPPS
jgi:tRNA/tmRNA/rRNA uracil-C5-methylase (TrmA/RlmC/RlmD family)